MELGIGYWLTDRKQRSQPYVHPNCDLTVPIKLPLYHRQTRALPISVE